MVSRMEKVDELIQQEVSRELHRLLPDFFITITITEVSRDLAYAKIWITSLVDIDKAVEQANLCKNEIQKTLALKVPLRKHPKINFVADTREIKAQRIDQLIEETKKED